MTSTEDKLRYFLKRVSTDLDAAQDRVRELEARATEPIAVVGMGCRFPGGVRSPEELWDLVAGGVDAMGAFPTDRGWDLDAVFGPGDHALVGGFLDGACDFDAAHFGISPREALAMDPQQRLLLEVSQEAVERAGIDPDSLRGSRTGVFTGTNGQDYMAVLIGSSDDVAGYMATGSAASVVSGRVSYVFGLEGPSVTVDTACSSSSTAVHLAVQALRSGECGLALAGGATVMSTPGMFGGYSQQQGMLAADGRCKAFADAADGTGFGEGVGVLVLERLSDAQRNGRRVLAVLRGSAVNSDGASNGLSAPNGPAQQRVIRQALADAGLTPAQIDAVEGHGTGTRLGDPIEAQALLAAYGQGRVEGRPLWLGSIKSNIGHTQAAAGVAGLIKMVMALRHGVLPPTLHVAERSSAIDWTDGAVDVLTQPVTWPATDRPRRAAVSSFGISGTNVHIVLEQAPEPEPAAPDLSDRLVPVAFSGRSAEAVRAQAARLRERVVRDGTRPADLAFSLLTGRATLPHRAAVVAADPERLAAGLAAVADGRAVPGVVTGTAGRATKPVFVFPGQGSQWAGMAVGLLESAPAFRAEVEACAEALAPHLDWSVLDLLRGAPGAPALEAPDVVQPALFAVMAGLAALWRAHGVEPAAVIGHSQGEIAAAYVAGALSREDAAMVVARRSTALRALSGRGGMVSVALPADQVRARLDGVSLAAVNGPSSTVVSGESAALDAFFAACEADGIRVRRVGVDYASHSVQVEEIEAELAEVLAGVAPRQGSVPFWSTVEPGEFATTGLDAGYWYRNLRQTVEFEATCRALMAAGHSVFVEVSPHPVLTVGVEETAETAGVDVAALGTLRRDEPGPGRFLAALAAAHVRGVALDWSAVLDGTDARIVDLPTTAFHGTRYWPASAAPPQAAADPADTAFWAAVRDGDLDTLTDTMGLDGSGAATLGDALPLLSSWQDRRAELATADAWHYRITWPHVATPSVAALTGTWLVVVPDTPLVASHLVDAVLAALGDGARPVQGSADRAELAERLGEAAAGAPVTGVVSLVGLACPAALAGGTALVQALGDARIAAPLWLLTCGAVAATAGDRVPHPEQAGLWGLGQVVGLEQPHRWGGLIDLPAELDARAADRLRGVLAGGHTEDQVALRGSAVHGRRIVRVAPGARPAARWQPRGAVVVTGATGALGARTARWLADHGAEHLLLLSRSGPDAPGAADLELDLRARGVSVTVAACDVADRDALAARIAELPADLPLTAVVHTAAVLDDGVLDAMTAERIATVIAPKADAARHLHELTAGLDLDAFVLFSSLAGTIGNGGQSSYAAANAQLDALAAHRRARGLSATSIPWGAWAEGAVGEGALAERMRRGGTPPMPPGPALDAMRRAVESGAAVAVVADVDWARFAATRLAGKGLALVGDLPEVRAVMEAATPVGPTTAPLRARLADLSPDVARQALLELVRDTAAAVLGHAGPEDVASDQPFRELGFDSLTAVELRNLVGASTGVTLPATAVFDHPTPDALAAFLATQLAVPPVDAPVPAAPAVRANTDEPIAIVGMGCRFPGGVRTPDQLWQLLCDGVDAISPLPGDRGWDLDRLVPPALRRADGSAPWEGGFLDAAPDFDAAFFGISPREALAMDPQQRLLLEVAQEAIENAGIDPRTLRGSRTGVFAGTNRSDYAELLVGTTEDVAGYVGTGSAASVVSGRVAYAFGLEGPAVSVDTACSSSSVALHLAVRALRAGECDQALAGGVSVMCTPGVFLEFGDRGVQALDNRCKAFADGADGTAWGEGVGLVVVERLSDAVRHGHDVLAVVRGSAMNSDGASNGLSAPNGPSQQRVIAAALADAGLTTADIDVVEAHGTGTRLGDPIEAQALLATYGQHRERPLLLGSVKSNIGHTQAAAGIAGVIKTVLALRHGTVPRTLHVHAPSSQVDWTAGAVEVLTEATGWPDTGRPRRAGVSSFGISGTNVHTVLEQGPPVPAGPDLPRPAVLPWLLAARTPAALADQATRLRGELLRTPDLDVLDVAATLATARTPFEHRAAVAGGDREALLRALGALAAGGSDAGLVTGRVDGGRLAVLFPGQGSQRAGAGAALHAAHPVFADAFDEACAHLDRHLTTPLREVAFGDGPQIDDTLIDDTTYTQPALFAVEVALYRLLEHWGVAPAQLAGHSIGELTAAHVAGVLSIEDAAALVAARGRLMGELPAGGAMVAVRAAEDAVTPLLTSGISVAAVNGPESVVVSGVEAEVLAVAAELEGRGHRTRRLRVGHAFHSPLVEPVLDRFREVAAGVAFAAPTVPIVSTRTGAVLTAAELADPEHWVRHVRQPVRFLDAVRTLHAAGARTFLEVGPGGALTSAGPDCVPTDGRVSFVPVLRGHRDEQEALVAALGELHVRGVALDWATWFAGTGARRVPLPTYPFQRTTFWPASVEPPAPAVAPDWDGLDELDLDIPLRDALPVLDRKRRERQEQALVDSWSYGSRWTPIPAGDPVTMTGTWLAVLPAAPGPVAERVLAGLAARGADVVRVTGDPDPEKTAAVLAAVPHPVAGVVSLLALDTAPLAGAASVPAGLAATVAVLQAGLDGPIWCLTSGAVAVRPGEPIADPLQGAVWGAGQVAGQELPARWGGLVDLPADPADLGERALDRLAAALTGIGVEDQLAVRSSGLFVRRLGRVRPGAPTGSPWTPRGTVLVTGGTGALGGHVARWLVARGARHLVLTSRRGPDAPGAAGLVTELEDLGAAVTVVACDVTDRAALAAVIAEHPPTAVVHTAAVLDDGVIGAMTPDRLQTVLAPKVAATVALHELTRHLDLDAFVLFSSLAGTFGNPGQVSYAAANAFLDAFAAHRHALGLPATAVAWGGWADAGMATDPVVAERMARGGMPPMAPETALAALGHAVDRGDPACMVADIDWARFAPGIAAARPRPLIADVPEVAALVRAAPTQAPAGTVDLRAGLAAASPADRRRLVLGLVRSEIAAVLGHASGDAVDPEQAFRDLGFDSVMSVELGNRLGAATGLVLESTLVFDEPNPDRLADRLMGELMGELLGELGPATEPDDDERLRAALAAIPVERIRAAGLLEALLALGGTAEAEPDVGQAEAAAIADMDVDDLVRMAWESRGA